MAELAPRWNRRALRACVAVAALSWVTVPGAGAPDPTSGAVVIAAVSDSLAVAADSAAATNAIDAAPPAAADSTPAANAIPNAPAAPADSIVAAPATADSIVEPPAVPRTADPPATTPAPALGSGGLTQRPVPRLGVRLRFEDLLDRAHERAAGKRITVGHNANARSPFLAGDDPGAIVDVAYSPWLDAVVELGGPGYLPIVREYYIVDGAYYTYDTADYGDPSLRVRTIPSAVHQARRIEDDRRSLMSRRRQATFADEGSRLLSGEGISVTVPFRMPGALSEIFGRGATNIKVTGRENITFGGESRVVHPFVSGEQGRGQSYFPRLNMEQELQVKLDGTIGDKVHVQVDHNSAGFGADANRINIYYEGYEDDIVRRIDLGGTSLALPGSNLVSFSGGHSGLFGIKSTMRLGGLDLTMIASKEEAEVETRTLTPGGASARPIVLAENRYERNRFYFYETPDLSGQTFYDFWGVNPTSLIEESEVANLRVFIDTQDGNTIEQRRFRGFAIAGLTSDTIEEADLELAALPDSLRAVALWPRDFDATADVASGRAGAWREIDRDDLGFVTVETGGATYILGFYLRNGSFGNNDVIGVLFDRPGRFGTLPAPAPGADPQLRLRLVRHPSQDSNFDRFPTAPLMMRHVYALSSTDLTNLELDIARAQTSLNPDVPPNVPTTTYLHMFGLDDLDTANNRVPDGIFDIQQVNLIDRDQGLLFMPGPRPFSPPDAVIIQRLTTGGVPADEAQNNFQTLFGGEVVDPRLYTLPADDPSLPTLVYQIQALTTGTQSDITLPLEAIEGTEVVKLDGRTLQRGTDYDVDPIGGRITLKGEALSSLTSASRIEVGYQFRPLFGGGRSTLLGVSGEYQLGTRGKLASVLLYESTGFADKRSPKLGEEPTRTVVADVNGTLRFQPNWMTRLVNLLPFADAGATSNINLSAEVAASVPNPNTRNDAFVDDLEGADDSEEQNLSREGWAWASTPIDDPRRPAFAADTLRVPLAFYNPSGRVKAGHLNPKLGEREVENGLNVLELGFDRTGFAHRDTVTANLGARDLLWSGVMRSFGVAGLDLTRTKSIEFWLNDKIGDPALRNGRLHIDLGTMSEDFVFRPSPLPGNARFNREAETKERFQASRDDLGWDLVSANCPSGEDEAEQLPFGSECFRPAVLNSADQHFLANGTEANEGRYDTEDLNSNGLFDESNSYFSLSIDLAAPDFIVTDVTPQYGNDPSISDDLKRGFQGWRKYRIDLPASADSLPEFHDPTETSPSLRRITALRLWFEDVPGTPAANSIFSRNMQIYGLRLNRNQWLDTGIFAVDGGQLPADSLAQGEAFAVGVINNKDDVDYVLVPNDIEIDEQGSQARRQSLRLNFANIQPGHEVLAERVLAAGGTGLDFTQYKRLAYWVHYPRSETAAMADTAEFFFRVGSDTLNYYEIAHRIPAGGSWLRLAVDLDQITGLKFPEDVAGAVVDTLQRNGRAVVQVSAPALDAIFNTIPLRVTRRGDPSLQRVLRLFVGVRNQAPGAPVVGLPPGTGRPVTGEAWFDNVRLEEIQREVGLAQSYSMQARFSDVFDVSLGYSRRDGEFRPLRQRLGTNLNQTSWQARVGLSDLGRLVPTFGLTIPIGYQYSWDRALPKFFQASDTRNTAERQIEQRSEGTRHAYNFSIAKRPSRFWFNKVTLDRLQFSYSEAHDRRRQFLSRDTSTTRSRNLAYDLSPRERSFPLWGRTRLNLMPTNLKFALQHSNGRATSYNVLRVNGADSLVRKPVSVSQSMNLTASTALRPLPILQLRYQFTEPRTFRQAHPYNEAERVRLFGYDFGLPGNRQESFGFDLTPRIAKLGVTLGFGDARVQQTAADGRPAPDLHNASSNRAARVSFDFGWHRRLINWVTRRGGRSARPPTSEPPPVEGEQDLPPPDLVDPLDEGGGGRPRRDFAPQEPHVDSLVVPPPLPAPAGVDSAFAPAAIDSAFAPVAVDSTQVPVVGEPQPSAAVPPPAAAPADTTARRRRRPPSPIDIARGAVRVVTGVEAIKVEYDNSVNRGYSNLPDAPSGAFRYGFSERSGLVGSVRYVQPPNQTDHQVLSLATGLPITRTFRIATRVKIDETIATTRSFATPMGGGPDRLTNTNENQRLDVTFPSFDFNVNGIERLPLFRRRLTTSSMQVNFARGSNQTTRFDQTPGGPKIEAVGRTETDRTTLTTSWTGQWRGGVTSTFSANQTNTNTESPGTRREAVSRSFTAGVRFKIAPKGGLPFPFMRGGLKGGMDVAVNSSLTLEDALRINQGTRPLVEGNTTTITLGARGDYSLSRNMNGALELGYTRQGRDDIQEQTVHTVRLGFNLTFLF